MKLKELVFTFLKGMGMGAADIVPGVSGGTIAFITGIYDKLLGSITSIKPSLISDIKNDGIPKVWEKVNGSFLLALVLGIFISIKLLASKINFFLENHPVLLWSFFLGLVLASVFYIAKTITKWNSRVFAALIIGSIVAYYITTLPPLVQSANLFYIFICGMIAICAMILPGISGSFILLILGAYKTVIGAVKELDFTIITVFGLGCIIGLLSFSKGLKWMLGNYRDITLAILTGFLIGSLNKLWPWKENIEELYTHSDGKIEYLQSNVLPANFDGTPFVNEAILWSIIGFCVILIMEIIAKKTAPSNK